MVRVGVVGFGFMGRTHFKCYRDNADASVVAICDADESRLKGTEGTAGNIDTGEGAVDLEGVELYTDFDKMLAEANLDAVSITLPTYMHRDFTIKALEAGVNVLCEKPMSTDIGQCEEMIAAAEAAGRKLQIGHCIRFWPEYAHTAAIVGTGEYGAVLAASFRRLSAQPKWSWNNWLLKESNSGGALVDLHIHDCDYIQYLFGMPNAVRSHAVKGPFSEFDHISTAYLYNNNSVITAEGGWIMAEGFGFEMSFYIVLEKATIVFDSSRQPTFKVCPADGEPFSPQVQDGDGYYHEIDHFLKTIQGKAVSGVITTTDSLNSVKLVLAEKLSAQTNKEVAI